MPTELPYLSQEQIDDNVHISCQVKVKEDMDIEIPEYLFNIQEM